GDQGQRLGGGLEVLGGQEAQAELLGEGAEQLGVGDQAARQGDLADGHAGVLGLVEDLPELVLVHVAEVDEDLAHAAAAGAAGGAGLGRGGLVLAGRDGRLFALLGGACRGGRGLARAVAVGGLGGGRPGGSGLGGGRLLAGRGAGGGRGGGLGDGPLAVGAGG